MRILINENIRKLFINSIIHHTENHHSENHTENHYLENHTENHYSENHTENHYSENHTENHYSENHLIQLQRQYYFLHLYIYDKIQRIFEFVTFCLPAIKHTIFVHKIDVFKTFDVFNLSAFIFIVHTFFPFSTY